MNDKMHTWLTQTDDVVGLACTNVNVPPTLVMDDAFREAYVQGYRHAIHDVREYLRVIKDLVHVVDPRREATP